MGDAQKALLSQARLPDPRPLPPLPPPRYLDGFEGDPPIDLQAVTAIATGAVAAVAGAVAAAVGGSVAGSVGAASAAAGGAAAGSSAAEGGAAEPEGGGGDMISMIFAVQFVSLTSQVNERV